MFLIREVKLIFKNVSWVLKLKVTTLNFWLIKIYNLYWKKIIKLVKD